MIGLSNTRDVLAADRRRLVNQAEAAQRSATIALVVMTVVVVVGAVSVGLLVKVQHYVSDLDIGSENYAAVIDLIDHEASLLVDDRYRQTVTPEVLDMSQAQLDALFVEEADWSASMEDALAALSRPMLSRISFAPRGALQEFEGSITDPSLLEVAHRLPAGLMGDPGAPMTDDERLLANAIVSRQFVAPTVRREFIMQDVVSRSQEGFRRLLVTVMMATSGGLALIWWFGLRPALMSMRGLTAGLNDHAAEIEHAFVQVSAAQRVAGLGYWHSSDGCQRITCSPELIEMLNLSEDELPTTLPEVAALLSGRDVGGAEMPENAVAVDGEGDDLALYLGLADDVGYHEINRTVALPGRPTKTIRERVESFRPAPGDPVEMIGVLVDISDITNAQQVISRMEKFEIINLLVSGVAHDFNNQLAIVLGNAEIALIDAEGRSRTNLKSIMAACESASALIDQLRQTTSDPSVLAENFSPAEIVERLIEAVSVPDQSILIDLQVEPAARQLVVTANRGLFETSVVNLLSNAFDAVDPDDGRVNVNVEVEAPDVHTTSNRRKRHEPEWLTRAGHRVVVSIADNGLGMAEEIRSRALQPFFSTKRTTGRTNVGLGLWSVYSFVKTWNGKIEINSEETVGTTVRMILPATVAPADRSPHEDSGGLTIDGTIILVEDAADLGDLLAESLRRSGPNVVSCRDVAEARRLLLTESSVDLVVTDVWLGVQPLGFEVARLALHQHPSAGVVLVSGSIVIDDIPEDLRTARCVLLAKPFSADRLQETAIATMKAAGLADQSPSSITR